MRQDAGRVARRAAAGDRKCRGGLRNAGADSGLQLRGHRRRHRRGHDPSAARRVRDHLPVQFSRHDSVLVPAVRDRLWQHRHSETIGARAADDAESDAADRHDRPAGWSGQPGERRPGCRERDSRSSNDPIGQLRRFHDCGEARVLAGRGSRQARAVSGRRQKSCRRAARCRSVCRLGGDRRQRVRLRRPAVPRDIACDYRRRSRTRRLPKRFRRGRAPESPGMAWKMASRWGLSSLPKAGRASWD